MNVVVIREFSGLKQIVSKFNGLREGIPVWSMRFEAFMSMTGCWNYLLADIEVAVGGTAKDTEYFLSQGLNIAHIKKSGIAWICLTETVSNTDLLDWVFAAQSPSGAWKMFCGWFLPNSVATQVKRFRCFRCGTDGEECRTHGILQSSGQNRRKFQLAWRTEIGRRCESKGDTSTC